MKDRVVLIFSGYNDRAVIAFCRYASKRGILFFIVAKGESDIIYKTDYSKNVLCNRRDNNLRIEDVLNFAEQTRREGTCQNILILPSSEYLNRFLLTNYDVLDKNKVGIGLCKKKVYELLSDKFSFKSLCELYDITIPSEVTKETLSFPIVIKPKSYISNSNKIYKPEVINDKQSLDIYLKDKNDQDFYLQEYVPGKSVYLLYYIFPNGDYSVFSQENLIQQNNGGSMILAKSSSYHEKDISAKFANMFIEAEFSGLLMIELKFHKNKFYMIEANPRLWGPSQLILDSGMDLFECFAFDNELIKSKKIKNYKLGTWYYWSGGLMNNLNENLPLMYHNFKEEDICNYKVEFEKSDIYNREDSESVFKEGN